MWLEGLGKLKISSCLGYLLMLKLFIGDGGYCALK
jgi:hypothetical protein